MSTQSASELAYSIIYDDKHFGEEVLAKELDRIRLLRFNNLEVMCDDADKLLASAIFNEEIFVDIDHAESATVKAFNMFNYRLVSKGSKRALEYWRRYHGDTRPSSWYTSYEYNPKVKAYLRLMETGY